jgi:hypothetical protein
VGKVDVPVAGEGIEISEGYLKDFHALMCPPYDVEVCPAFIEAKSP